MVDPWSPVLPPSEPGLQGAGVPSYREGKGRNGVTQLVGLATGPSAPLLSSFSLTDKIKHRSSRRLSSAPTKLLPAVLPPARYIMNLADH